MFAKEKGDRAGEGKVFGELGDAADHRLGEFKQAITYHNQSLIFSKEMDDGATGDVFRLLGDAYECLGDCREAVTHYSQSLIISKEMGDWAKEQDVFRLRRL